MSLNIKWYGNGTEITGIFFQPQEKSTGVPLKPESIPKVSLAKCFFQPKINGVLAQNGKHSLLTVCVLSERLQIDVKYAFPGCVKA